MQPLVFALNTQFWGAHAKVNPGGSPVKLFTVMLVSGNPMIVPPSESVMVSEYASPSHPEGKEAGHINCAGVQPGSGVQTCE
jgi:hypothetical protein